MGGPPLLVGRLEGRQPVEGLPGSVEVAPGPCSLRGGDEVEFLWVGVPLPWSVPGVDPSGGVAVLLGRTVPC